MLNIFKVLEKNKMRSLSSILSLHRNEFNKFNKTGAQMLDSIYHMRLKLFCNRILGVKTSTFCKIYATYMSVIS